jgi:general secretion pathway protein K
MLARWPFVSKNTAGHVVRGSKAAHLTGKQSMSPILLNPGGPQTHHESRSDKGLVLLMVLWWLAVLMFLATQITAATRSAILISSNIRGSAVAEAQADGAVNEAIFQVLAQHWKADGVVHIVRGPQASAEVRIDDEGGKVDPNVAPAILMQALLHECGATSKIAADLAAAISEWRSVDMLRSDGAATAQRYRAAGRNYVPPNARFVSVDELGLVLGMTSRLLACLQPHVSIYSLSVPSLQTPDPLVRQALTEAYPFDAAQPIAADVHEVAVIRVTATAQVIKGGRFRRVAVVRVAPVEPEDDFTYRILSWE